MPLDVLVRLKIGGQKPDLLPFRKTLQAIYHKGFAVRPLEIDPVKGAGEMALVATPYLALMIKPEGGKVHDFVNVVAGKDKKMAVGENRGGRERHQIFVGRQISCGENGSQLPFIRGKTGAIGFESFALHRLAKRQVQADGKFVFPTDLVSNAQQQDLSLLHRSPGVGKGRIF